MEKYKFLVYKLVVLIIERRCIVKNRFADKELDMEIVSAIRKSEREEN